VHAYPEDAHNPEVARKAIQEILEQAANEIGETAPQVTVNVATRRGSGRHGVGL
jgi:hypothetical protein